MYRICPVTLSSVADIGTYFDSRQVCPYPDLQSHTQREILRTQCSAEWSMKKNIKYKLEITEW